MLNKFFLTLFIVLNFSIVFAQEIEIKGEVYDEYLAPFFRAKITTSEGVTTTTDTEGFFSLKTKTPTTVTVSYLGFSTEKVKINTEKDKVNVILKENTSLDQIIYSASKTPERLFESPVSLEWISLNEIKRAPSISFYESLENLKNVDVKTNSILLKSINTRGFSTIENNRFVQLIDGADNVLPISNLSPGNLIGLVDSDIEDVEVLTGASSALYGVNAFNGVLLINSKNPFDYQGISAKIQGGVNQQDDKMYPFYNPSVRGAYKFDDRFAAKVSFSFYSGEEWHADDTRSQDVSTNRVIEGTNGRNGQYYNGVNSYGDEYALNLKLFPLIAYLYSYFDEIPNDLSPPENVLKFIPSLPNQEVSRGGYLESDLVDNRTKNIKFNSSLNYRPFKNEKFEIIWSSRFNNVKSLFQSGANKFALDDAHLNQHTLTFKGDDFVVRGYVNTSDSGKSYNINRLASGLNDELENPYAWGINYFGAFVNSYLIDKEGELAYEKARKLADDFMERIYPGTLEFTRQVANLKSLPIAEGGAGLRDFSRVYHAEGNFNFNKYIDFVEILLGASYRRTKLDTKGSFFTDVDKPINIKEFGVFTQFRKKFIEDKLKLAFTTRYDKSQNYEGTFSPRLTASYALGKNKHNIRFAAQSAYRQPKSTDQYFGLQTGVNRYTVGNLQETLNEFKAVRTEFDESTTIVDGNNAFKPAFTATSYKKFYADLLGKLEDKSSIIDMLLLGDYSLLETVKLKKGLEPEQVRSFELGYRAMIDLSVTNILEIDINGYFNNYKNFIVNENVYVPFYGDPSADRYNLSQILADDPFDLSVLSVISRQFDSFTIPTNTEATINSYGVALGLNTRLFQNYLISANYTFNDYDYNEKKYSAFKTEFNIPKHSVKLVVGNQNVYEHIGFNLAARWNDGYLYESEFADAYIKPRIVLDGQITYHLPSLKSRFRVGGNNLTGKPYYDNVGNGKVGSTYYFSWIIND